MDPFAIYLTKPVGSNDTLNCSLVLVVLSNLTYSLSFDLAPILKPLIVAAGLSNGSIISSLPRNNFV